MDIFYRRTIPDQKAGRDDQSLENQTGSSEKQNPQISALQKLLLSSQRYTPNDPYLSLALQIAHNLRYQHNWTDLLLHRQSPISLEQKLSRPILSGLPPQRLYVHPDEQIELLQRQKNEGKTGMPELEREREWVLPSHLREKWSLRRFAGVFDALDAVPGERDGEALFVEDGVSETVGDVQAKDAKINPWRLSQPKRLLLATLDDDSTVVYYIMHDGTVKPRQN